jgi:hypothetical protein
MVCGAMAAAVSRRCAYQKLSKNTGVDSPWRLASKWLLFVIFLSIINGFGGITHRSMGKRKFCSEPQTQQVEKLGDSKHKKNCSQQAAKTFFVLKKTWPACAPDPSGMLSTADTKRKGQR